MSNNTYQLLGKVVTVLLILLLLNTYSSKPDDLANTEKCLIDGKTVTFECRTQALAGSLTWEGIGFDCPSRNTAANNVLTIPVTSLLCSMPPTTAPTGICGLFSANLTCDGGDYVISVLQVVANYSRMNGSGGGNISCHFHGETVKTFPIRVGVIPNPPSPVRVTTQQDESCLIEWAPPNESVGGIGGYTIQYSNCGQCTPAAGFLNQTEVLTAECIDCNNNVCHFEINTVSEDCWLDSPPVEATSEFPINLPKDIAVAINCSSLTLNPPIYAKWIYTFSEESRSAFSGFLVTISDQSGRSVEDILPDSTARSKYINSTLLKDTGFVGDIWNVTVEVAFDEDREKFAYDSIQFSADDTIMSDRSSAVTPRQCIEVSINSHCNERSDSFQAQIQFINGTCGSESELTNTTTNYTLNEDYTTCVPIGASTICYSAVIFHNKVELNRAERQELVLMPCTLKAPNYTMVKINSTIGDIPLGVEVTVPHNTWLYLSCDLNCTLDHNQTRCANGTFQPAVTPILQDGCRCSDSFEDSLTIIIASVGGVGALGVLVVVVILVLVCCCFINRKRKSEHRNIISEGIPESDGDEKIEPYVDINICMNDLDPNSNENNTGYVPPSCTSGN